MPTKPDKPTLPPDCPLPQNFVENLEEVVRIVRNQVGTEKESAQPLALLRIVHGVAPENWENFASTHGLHDWLCLPLKEDLAASVDNMLSVQSHLAFQLDHDALTGIGNRRYFTRRLEDEVQRALRSRTELSLLYIDLDDFKRINDTFGHACGDMVLRRLAEILQSSVRHYDIAARIGGEEFVVILPATSCWTGIMLGNRVLDIFRREQFSCNATPFTMTFSGGVSSLALLDKDNRNCSELLQSADTALYEAKGNGKNNIFLAKSAMVVKEVSTLVHAQEKRLLFGYPSPE
jgi:diguanylate cyclase (GGDEF)-like protein